MVALFIVAMKNVLVNRVIPKVIWSVFGPAFTLFEWSLQSKEIFIKSQYEMLKLSI
jgi:hypothetical protein